MSSGVPGKLWDPGTLELVEPEVMAPIILHGREEFVPPARLLERRVGHLGRRLHVRMPFRLRPRRAVRRPIAVREIIVRIVAVARERRVAGLQVRREQAKRQCQAEKTGHDRPPVVKYPHYRRIAPPRWNRFDPNNPRLSPWA